MKWYQAVASAVALVASISVPAWAASASLSSVQCLPVAAHVKVDGQAKALSGSAPAIDCGGVVYLSGAAVGGLWNKAAKWTDSTATLEFSALPTPKHATSTATPATRPACTLKRSHATPHVLDESAAPWFEKSPASYTGWVACMTGVFFEAVGGTGNTVWHLEFTPSDTSQFDGVVIQVKTGAALPQPGEAVSFLGFVNGPYSLTNAFGAQWTLPAVLAGKIVVAQCSAFFSKAACTKAGYQ